jgi:class 3 adenylate cyclase
MNKKEADLDHLWQFRSIIESAAEPDQILVSQDTNDLVKKVIACVKKDELKVKGIVYPEIGK